MSKVSLNAAEFKADPNSDQITSTTGNIEACIEALETALDGLGIGGAYEWTATATGGAGAPTEPADKAPDWVTVEMLLAALGQMKNPPTLDRDAYIAVMHAIAATVRGIEFHHGPLAPEIHEKITVAVVKWAMGDGGPDRGDEAEERRKWDRDLCRRGDRSSYYQLCYLSRLHELDSGLCEFQGEERPAEAPEHKPTRYKRFPAWEKLLSRMKSGKPEATIRNAIIAFRHAPESEGVFRFNRFGMTVEISRRPPWLEPWKTFEPHDLLNVEYNYARNWLQDRGILTSKQDVESAVLTVAYNDQFHPVLDYLDGLKWDGVPRIDTWMIDHLGAEDTELNRVVGRQFLIGMVARIRNPGCKLDTMLILEGPQGILKSSALKTMGAPWFTDHIPDIGSKDAMLQLLPVWLIEFAEMDKMSRAEVTKVKSFQTTATDLFRAPYDRHPEFHPRHCAFAATINPESTGYLKDATGARRNQPTLCAVGWPKGRKIDIAKLAEAKDTLFAEARHRYEQGEKWWLDTVELEDAAAAVADARYEGDVWDDIVLAWAADQESVTSGQVLEGALFIPKKDWNSSNQRRVATILGRAGWERKQDGAGTKDADTVKVKRLWRFRNPTPPVKAAPAGSSNVVVPMVARPKAAADMGRAMPLSELFP